MPKSSKINESYLLEACEAAQAQKKPNISKITREYGVPYATLRDHIKKHIVCMRDRNMPVTPKLLEEYANQALQRAGESRQYNQLAGVVKKDTLAWLVYNFDECGFQPGEGKSRKIDPWFIFKGNGIFMESWFNESEALPPDTTIATSPNGWISDELAVQWLQSFINATNERTKKGEKQILIFDGHGSHLTVKFLQLCEDNGVIPFRFLPHTTHLCQPLDVQEKAFNQRIIREAFKDRGIWPVNRIPDIYAPNLDKMTPSTPPSQPPSRPPSSSNIDISPPRTIQALKKNQAKLSKHVDLLTPKLQRNLERIFEHNRITAEHLAIANKTISQIRAAQAPLQHQYTKRQVKPLSQSGILTLRDANRSIASRKAKDAATQERRLQTQWEKVHVWHQNHDFYRKMVDSVWLVVSLWLTLNAER
ncbi:transposase [Aspergillus fumigatus Z5]|nr:transposase [Aspergillus fumigatus Z5]